MRNLRISLNWSHQGKTSWDVSISLKVSIDTQLLFLNNVAEFKDPIEKREQFAISLRKKKT